MIGDDKLFAPLPPNKRPVSTRLFKRSVGWQANQAGYQKRYEARLTSFKRKAKREGDRAAR